MCVHLRVKKTACSFGRKVLAPKIPPLVTISIALDMHEVTRPPWITANDCSILAVNNGLLTSSLLYVSCFPVPLGCIGWSSSQFVSTVNSQAITRHHLVWCNKRLPWNKFPVALSGLHWRNKGKERKTTLCYAAPTMQVMVYATFSQNQSWGLLAKPEEVWIGKPTDTFVTCIYWDWKK